MRKALSTMMCLLAMMAAGTGLKAQEVTITLNPGYTWISYLGTEPQDFATVLGSFTPTVGDNIMSQWGSATYLANGQWRGTISQFYPGYGYMYKSNRPFPVTLTFSGQPPLQLVVTTSDPTGITTFSMTCGGEVADVGNSEILVRGVCWSTSQNPTISDPHTTNGYGTGSFISWVDGLEMNTIYYVRAYALTFGGIAYGEQKMFSTKNGVPTLTTSDASEIGTTWATCGGDISDDGGIEVTERGICWSTDHNPTIEGNHGANGAGLGSFSVNMNNLEANTTYYVRAYATNSHTTAYGNEVFFRTEVEQTWQNGILPGQFSVSATHQVQFSQGNLQYQASTDSWRFASDQWEYVGADNSNISATYDGYIDLFGWGTSGYNHGANCYQPWSTSTSYSDYYAYGSYSYNLFSQTGQADWGYNPISNGGNQENLWRTLTNEEWQYVLNTRTTASGTRYAKAKVFGVNGVILLPDDWSESTYTLNNTNNSGASFSSNMITASQWVTLESAGAVFLPAAGYRYGTSVNNVGSLGFYWSASYYYSDSAYSVYFNVSNLRSSYYNRYYGRSVRLVCPAE